MRKLSLILAMTMVIGLVGCNKSYSNTAPETEAKESGSDVAGTQTELKPEADASLVIWEDDDNRFEYMKYVAEKFKEKYSINVEVKKMLDIGTKLVQDGPSGLGPDLLEAAHDQAGSLLTAGLIQPNDTDAQEVKDNFPSSVTDCLTYEGKLYGYPMTLSTFVLIYNKALVKKAPESFSEIFDFAKEFNDPSDNKYAIMWDVTNSYYSHCFIAGYDGYIFGNNGTDPNDIGLNSKGAVDGLTYLKSFKSILDVNSADVNNQIIDGLFTSGKIAYTIGGQWNITQYQNAGIDVGTCVLPKLDNGKDALSYLGVQTLYVNSYTKYPNASKLFAKMAISEEMLQKRYEITKEIPARSSLADSEAIKKDEFSSTFMAQAQSSVPMPAIPQMSNVWTPYGNAMKAVWDEDQDPQEALDTCVDTIKSLYE